MNLKFAPLLFCTFVGAGLIGAKASAMTADKLWRGSTISAAAAAKRWGSAEFDASKFKSGDVKARAAMAAALQRLMTKTKNPFLGKTTSEIRNLLGRFSGFYFTDAYPTYLIEIGKSQSEETWQIVFLLDRDRRVSNVILHKNCCEL